jgi:hypothetical protein
MIILQHIKEAKYKVLGFSPSYSKEKYRLMEMGICKDSIIELTFTKRHVFLYNGGSKIVFPKKLIEISNV